MYVHQYYTVFCFLFSIFSFPSIKRNGRLTGQTEKDFEFGSDPWREFKKLFKNVIRNNFNDFITIFNFPIIHSTFLSGSYYGNCRSSTTSPSSFLKFWRAARRNEMEQQLDNAPSSRSYACLKAMKDHNYLIICHRLHDSNFLSHVSNHQNCFGCPRAVCAKRRLYIFSG